MRQRIRVVYWAVLALRREYSIMELDVSNNNRTAQAGSLLETRPVPSPPPHRTTVNVPPALRPSPRVRYLVRGRRQGEEPAGEARMARSMSRDGGMAIASAAM